MGLERFGDKKYYNLLVTGDEEAFPLEENQRLSLRHNLFDNDAIVTKGQKVATSGKGGNYPSGILIGEVKDVSLNDDSIISTVYVSPVSNMKSFDYCLVIGKEESK